MILGQTENRGRTVAAIASREGKHSAERACSVRPTVFSKQFDKFAFAKSFFVITGLRTGNS